MPLPPHSYKCPFNHRMKLIVFQVFVSGVARNTEILLARTFDIFNAKCTKISKRVTIKAKYNMKWAVCAKATTLLLFWLVPGPHLIHINSLIYTFSCITCYIKGNKSCASWSKWKTWQMLQCNKTWGGILLKLLLKKCFMFTESRHFRGCMNLCWPKGE